MTAKQVSDALTAGLVAAGVKGQRPLEFLAFDTCLMAGNEVMYEFQNLAKTYIASAEIDFGLGMDYQATLGYIHANREASAIQIATAEVSHWNAHHTSVTATAEDGYIRAHAAFDMSKFPAYVNAWRNLVTTMTTSNVQWLEVGRKQYKTLPAYWVRDVAGASNRSALRDVGQFLQELTADNIPASVASDASTVKAALDAMVLNVSLGSLRSGKQSGLHGEVSPPAVWKSVRMKNGVSVTRKQEYEVTAWHQETMWGKVLDKLADQDGIDNSAPPVVTTSASNLFNPDSVNQPSISFTPAQADCAEASLRLFYRDGADYLDLGVLWRQDVFVQLANSAP